MVEPARFVASTIAKAGLPSYEYRFSYVADSLLKKVPGAFHATEIPFVFDTVKEKYGAALTAADEEAAQKMHAYWLNFVKSGNPNGAGLPHWPQYSPKSDELMNFTEHGPTPEADPWKQRLDLAVRLEDRLAASKPSSKKEGK